MAFNTGGFRHTLLSLSVLVVLAGCGGPATTENPMSPSGGSNTGPIPGTDPGTNPGTNPGTDPGTNPGTGPGTNSGTDPNTPNPPNPPAHAIGVLATANANPAVLTSTRTQVYTLNAPVLANGGWQEAQVLNQNSTRVTSARVAFDAAGNGFAVWTQGSDMLVRRYNAATSSWGTPVVLDSNTTDEAYEARIVIDSESGNALAAWAQSDGTAASLYVSRYNVFTSTWGAPELIEQSDDPVVTASENSFLAISGSHAAVAWRQGNGTVIDIYLSRLENGSWTAPVVVDSLAQPALHPEVAIDPSGNATVAWRQDSTGADTHDIYSRRWDNVLGAFTPVQQMNTDGDRQPRLRFDAAGNGFLLWGNGVQVRQFDAASATWSAQITIQNQSNDSWAGEIAVADNGDALAAWVEYDGAADSVYARRYDAATQTWGSVVLVETMSTSASIDVFPTVSLRGTEGVIAWIQENNRPDLYGVKLSNGVFGPATLLETYDESPSQLSSAVDAAGNASVVWIQRRSINEARFATANLVVPNGATWQSLAQTLYGVNAPEAGIALQAAMGGGPLVSGTILSGFPTSLTVTTSVPAYYTVQSTDTWAHVAQTVYGVTDVAAITQLRNALGNPTLSAGMQLVVPSAFQYTTSADYSAPLNWSLVNTTATTYHPLDPDALVFPMDAWSPAAPLESGAAEATSPQVAFAANGNGIAVWAQGSDVIARRYVASTGNWSTPVVLDSNPADALWPRLAMDRATGNAVVSWAQSDGAAVSMYVSNFDASSNSWSAALSIETGNFDVIENGAISMVGGHAAATWSQSDGTATNAYLSRLVAGTWTAPTLLDTSEYPAQQSVVATDSNGNTIVLWRQREAGGGDTRIFARRWDNNTQSFGTITALNGDGERFPRIALDAQGNGFATWWGGGVFARRYNATTNTWGPQVALHNGDPAAWRGELAVDANGDALLGWVEHDGTAASMYARYFNAAAGTWGNSVLLENSNDDVSIDVSTTVSLVNGGGVVAWVSFNDTEAGSYAARFGNGVWGAATLLQNHGGSELTSHIDGNNNATVLWLQGSLQFTRSNGTPYYIVPAGATWQSIANALYGVNSVAAADALRTAMSNPTLTAGLHLQSPPATLVLTPAVPTYYLVQSGDTWQSITQDLYGASATEAATALWNRLGRPTLIVGQQLVVPSTLEYSIEED